MESYTQLSYEDRVSIATLRLEGYSCRRIAVILKRHHTTISREVKRNFPTEEFTYHYSSQVADELDRKRRSQSRLVGWLRDSIIRRYVRRKLKQRWSPEQIAGRISMDVPGKFISYESIYSYIYRHAKHLIQCLARKHRRRQGWTYFSKTHGNQIPFRIDISERPERINQRQEFGHWEADQIVSRSSSYVLSVLVERTSRLVKIARLNDKTALLQMASIRRRLTGLSAESVKSITYDNGPENALHYRLNKALNTDSYFCKPYHSWEKGTVENTNGLIRRYLPKKTDFSLISLKIIKAIENTLNNRPRKCLQFKTPNEAFYKVISGALSH